MKNLFVSKARNIPAKNVMSGRTTRLIRLALCASLLCLPLLALASVEGSLSAVQDKLVGTLLPMAAMCGLAFAGLSFVMGHPNAKMRLAYGIVGAIVGFGAESIINLIRSLIN